MHFSPYRVAAKSAKTAESSTFWDDAQLLPFYGFVWIAGLARLIVAATAHESFATEITLATIMVIVLPMLAKPGLRDVVSNAISRKHQDS